MTQSPPSPDRTGRQLGTRLFVLLCAVLVSVSMGSLRLGTSLENALRGTRDAARAHNASGDIVVAGIDDRSIARLGAWPWPRTTYARLSDRLREAGARRMLFDIDFSSPSTPAADTAFAAALARWKEPPVLAARFVVNELTGDRIDQTPAAQLRHGTRLANINMRYAFFTGTVTDLPYDMASDGALVPTMAAALADRAPSRQLEGKSFPIDFSIRMKSVPTFSIVDLLEGKVDRRLIAGREVIIGAVSGQLNDLFVAPGKGLMPGVFFHILGAETLKAGSPIDIGWAIPLAIGMLLAAWPIWRRGAITFLVPLSLMPVAIAVAFGLDRFLIFTSIVPTIFALAILAGGNGWLRLRQLLRLRGTTNLVSGLPNLEALRKERTGGEGLLITARVQNFAQISAALGREQEQSLVEQIASRLRLGLPTRLYQGDEGIFAWITGNEHGEQIGEHLDALHSLFRSPAVVDGSLYDISVTFGVDGATDRSLANRLGSALVAADEAASEGARWKLYDIERSKDSAWKLSLLSQLDAAIDDGGLWVAYQPKLDLATGRIVGAEALVRWTHAEKGSISPDEFIKAAEQNNRIERLTGHVLDRAIAAAATINGRGRRFGIAVNLSARLLDGDAILDTIRNLLARHELDPALLTLEVTETATLVDDVAIARRLGWLREHGIQLSIDDYGTGLSTLEYLRMIPATEIKIDKSFVQAMTTNDGDRMIVRSTIELAHSLGRKVVAEGIEDQPTLDALREMGCDIAQGYLISRPVPFSDLVERLFDKDAQQAA